MISRDERFIQGKGRNFFGEVVRTIIQVVKGKGGGEREIYEEVDVKQIFGVGVQVRDRDVFLRGIRAVATHNLSFLAIVIQATLLLYILLWDEDIPSRFGKAQGRGDGLALFSILMGGGG